MAETGSSHWLSNPHAPDIEARIRQAIEGYAAALVPLVGESYGPSSVQQAWREFMPGSNTPFTGGDAHSELFFSWFFHRWSPVPEKGDTITDPTLYGTPPTQAYLARHASRLNPLLRRYLEACLETPLGFYQVVKCYRQSGFRAWDIFAGMQIEVIDSLASSSLSDGDIIFAHIPSLDGIWVIDAISPVSFPSSFQGHLIDNKIERQSSGCSDGALRKLYFDLLDTSLREGSGEVRNVAGEADGRWDVIFGPRP